MPRLLPNASSPLSSPHRVLDISREQLQSTDTSTNRLQTPRPVLTPGEWLRAVSDVRAPFGFDRMPTVWG